MTRLARQEAVTEASKRTHRRRRPGEGLVEMGRLKALSDGVVAFALTLLVLDIRVPSDIPTDWLPAAIAGLGPKFAVYLLSFVLIGGAWGSHQRMFGQIERGDGLMVWWSLLSLLPITLVPATAALLGDHPSTPLALVIFALNVIGIQVTSALLWRHASRHRLIDVDLDPRVVVSVGRRLWFVATCFAISIAMALISVPLTYLAWTATFVLVFTTDWLSWRQAGRTTEATIPIAGATTAEVRIRRDGGELHVDDGADAQALLMGTFGGGVERRTARSGNSAEIRLASPRPSAMLNLRYPWAWGVVSLLDWDIALTHVVPVALAVDVSSGRAFLNLERLRITRLDLDLDTGEVDATVPATAGLTTIKIHGRTAAIVLRLPDTVAASVTVAGGLAAVQVDPGRFPAAGPNEYRSPDYATATNRVAIEAEVSSGLLRVVGARDGEVRILETQMIDEGGTVVPTGHLR